MFEPGRRNAGPPPDGWGFNGGDRVGTVTSKATSLHDPAQLVQWDGERHGERIPPMPYPCAHLAPATDEDEETNAIAARIRNLPPAEVRRTSKEM